jgi:hypothetical protein
MPRFEDDEEDDDEFDFDKDRVDVEVGVEFEGLHNITLCTEVPIRLSDPVGSSRRLQEIIQMLKKGIPACEYTVGDLALNKDGQIDVFDEEAAAEADKVREIQERLLNKKKERENDGLD